MGSNGIDGLAVIVFIGRVFFIKLPFVFRIAVNNVFPIRRINRVNGARRTKRLPVAVLIASFAVKLVILFHVDVNNVSPVGRISGIGCLIVGNGAALAF